MNPDIHFAVIECVNRNDTYGGPDHIVIRPTNHLTSGSDQDHSERLVVLSTIFHQFPILILENVQLQLGVREKDRVDGKERHFFKPIAH